MNHLKTAVLTIILAGGTLIAYATAYTLMDRPALAAAVAQPGPLASKPALAARIAAGREDISVREACSVFEGAGERTRCVQSMNGAARAVRIIAFAGADQRQAEGRSARVERAR